MIKKKHTVLKDESLFDISIKYDCNIWRLKYLNKLKDIHLTVGQELIIEESQTQDHYSMIDRNKLLQIDEKVPITCRCANGYVEGKMTIRYEYLQFDVKDTKDELLNFVIYVKEVQKIKFNPISELLQIYLWGNNGRTAPMKVDNQLEVIEILLKQTKGKTKQLKPWIRKNFKLKDESGIVKSMEAVSFVLHLLYYEHEYIVQDSLSSLIITLNYQLKPIECKSSVYQFQLVQIDLDSGFVEVKKQQLAQKEQKIKYPQLKSESRILEQWHVNQLSKYMPTYLQNNDWYLIYSPQVHGSSYEELLRRTQNIGPHWILLKENHIFGAFVSQSWWLSKMEFFGNGESFLFTFKDHLRCYLSTGANNCYQMADETGISIGAGDHYGLYINHTLMRGSTNKCDTFNNEPLANKDFNITDLEIWGMDEDVLKNIKLTELKKNIFR